MTKVDPALRGRVLLPGDQLWDEARRVYNPIHDLRPDAIALPYDAVDVARVVRWASRSGMRIVPQSGGHNPGPHATLAGCLLLDLRRLQELKLDVSRRQVRAGAGVRWRSVTAALAGHGLAALHGSSPEVAVTGYSLGGGIGWLSRRHGLQAGAVTAIETVTADGERLRVDGDNDPELFWALRGGGGAFAVVTALEFDVQPVPELSAGTLVFGLQHSGAVLHAWRELLGRLPDELTTWVSLLRLPDAPDLPAHLRGGQLAVVFVAHLGAEEEARDLLAPLLELEPISDTVRPATPEVLGDLAMDPPLSPAYRSGHQMLGQLTAGDVDRLVAAAGPDADTHLAMVQLRHLGGALSRPAPQGGARRMLPGQVAAFSLGVTDGPAGEEGVRSSLAAVDAALADHRIARYPNFVEERADFGRFFDGATWERLRAVKATYDPADVIRANHHVAPGRALREAA